MEDEAPRRRRADEIHDLAVSDGRLASAALPTETEEAVPPFAEIYRENFAFVWRTIRRLGVRQDRLDDIVQDVFLTLSQRLSKFDPERGHLRSFLYGIMTNIVLNERRRWRRKDMAMILNGGHVDSQEGGERDSSPGLSSSSSNSSNLIDRLPSPSMTPAQAVEEQQAFELANQLLAEIPEDRREVLVLADLEEMPMIEVAESLSINVNTAYARLRTARRELDEALARHHARSSFQQGRRSTTPR